MHGDKVYAVPECRVLDLLCDGGEHNGSASHVVDVGLGRVVVRFHQEHSFLIIEAEDISDRATAVPSR